MLQGLLKGVMSDGWAGIENAGKRAAELGAEDQARRTEHALREARIARAALTTPEGQALLLLLLEKTILRGPSEEELMPRSLDLYAVAKAKREGGNGVVFMLLNMLRAPDAPHSPEGGST
jgi:hypothetical protein